MAGMQRQEPTSSADWRVLGINRPEDLSEAVQGAGLSATQLSGNALGGSLAFREREGILTSSGLLRGRVALYGPLSRDRPTLGVGIRMAAGSRHWMSEYPSGSVGVFLPNDEHDALYTHGSLYAAVTLDFSLLEQLASELDLVLDREQLAGTGVHPMPLSSGHQRMLLEAVLRVHRPSGRDSGKVAADDLLIGVLIQHLARTPRVPPGRSATRGHARVVERARSYIESDLSRPVAIAEVARAAGTSQRTLYRAFLTILGESPTLYVRRRRLHRIRSDLRRGGVEAIGPIATRWGIPELGRMAGWYRDLFAESPSQTLRDARRSFPA